MATMDLDARGFANSLMHFVNLADKNHQQIIQKTCLALYRAIVERTPVDTGVAKRGWGITTGAVVEGGDAEGAFHFEIEDDVVTIYNNVEYISYLESGSSQQAPSGMVALSLAEFEAHFLANLRTMEVDYK